VDHEKPLPFILKGSLGTNGGRKLRRKTGYSGSSGKRQKMMTMKMERKVHH